VHPPSITLLHFYDCSTLSSAGYVHSIFITLIHTTLILLLSGYFTIEYTKQGVTNIGLHLCVRLVGACPLRPYMRLYYI
jgi:hypothetical protein